MYDVALKTFLQGRKKKVDGHHSELVSRWNIKYMDYNVYHSSNSITGSVVPVHIHILDRKCNIYWPFLANGHGLILI